MTGTTDRDYLRGNEFLPHPTINASGHAAYNPLAFWLVVFVTHRDGTPVKSFTTEETAREFVLDNPPHHPFDPIDKDHRLCPEVAAALKVYGFDDPGYASAVHGYEVWHFAAGLPVKVDRYYWPGGEDDPVWWPGEGYGV